MSAADRDAQRATLLRILRDLPDRKAPVTLEVRVLEELARRAAQPWWQRGYAAWPVPARAAFLLLCAALVLAPFFGNFYPNAGAIVLGGTLQRLGVWMNPALVAYNALAGSAAAVARSIPAAWIELLVAGTALLYCVLFGISAAGYHVLSTQPSRKLG